MKKSKSSKSEFELAKIQTIVLLLRVIFKFTQGRIFSKNDWKLWSLGFSSVLERSSTD